MEWDVRERRKRVRVKGKGKVIKLAMLYKHPGPHYLHDEWFDHKVVPAPDVEQALLDGWHLTTTEALENSRTKLVQKKEEPEPEVISTSGYIAPGDLTSAIIDEIFDAEGTQKVLSKRYNVSTYTIHRIKTGKL